MKAIDEEALWINLMATPEAQKRIFGIVVAEDIPNLIATVKAITLVEISELEAQHLIKRCLKQMKADIKEHNRCLRKTLFELGEYSPNKVRNILRCALSQASSALVVEQSKHTESS